MERLRWNRRMVVGTLLGFGLEGLPLNGLVWYPEGEGPFPLVLIVHGNHAASRSSDPGYEYLGRHLASRGSIAVSVDENFLNGTLLGDPLGSEMPLRGWLLLEHLAQWQRWNSDSEFPLFGRIDTGAVALLGHSRGRGSRCCYIDAERVVRSRQ